MKTNLNIVSEVSLLFLVRGAHKLLRLLEELTSYEKETISLHSFFVASPILLGNGSVLFSVLLEVLIEPTKPISVFYNNLAAIPNVWAENCLG